ncbi:MAG: 50S ribosomal protein L29 [bacterium]
MSASTELRSQSAAELREGLEELLKELFQMRMQKGMGQLTQSHKLKQTKRQIARIKTIINEKSGEQA